MVAKHVTGVLFFARAQAKVARARAWVCQGLATPLTQRENMHTYTHMHAHA